MWAWLARGLTGLMLAVVLAAGLGPSTALAQDAGAAVSVTPPTAPTPVKVDVLFIKLDRVSDASDPQPTADVQLVLRLVWSDPRLAGPAARYFLEDDARAELDRIWQPDLAVYNEIGARQIGDVELSVSPAGEAIMRERMTVKLPVDFDLRRFPFDHQVLPILFRSFAGDTGQVVLALAPGGARMEADAGLPEWKLDFVRGKVVEARPVGGERAYSQLRFELGMQRIGAFYLTKILLPLALIVILSWSNFWITGRGDGRIRLTFLCLLAVIAYETTLSRYLPRLAFLTFFDFIVLLSMLSLALTVAQNAWVHHLLLKGRDGRGEQVDRWGRRLIPGGILLGALVGAIAYFA